MVALCGNKWRRRLEDKEIENKIEKGQREVGTWGQKKRGHRMEGILRRRIRRLRRPQPPEDMQPFP
jgi:hypothetical protein